MQETTNYLSTIFTKKQTEKFYLKLHDFVWADILALEDVKNTYDGFLNVFSTYYNKGFPKVIYFVSFDNKRNTKIIQNKVIHIRKISEK